MLSPEPIGLSGMIVSQIQSFYVIGFYKKAFEHPASGFKQRQAFAERCWRTEEGNLDLSFGGAFSYPLLPQTHIGSGWQYL